MGSWFRNLRNQGSGKTPIKTGPNYQQKYNDLNSKYGSLNKNYQGLSSRYNSLNSQWQRRLAEDSADPNRNLKAATIKGNEANTRAISSFNSMAENLTNKFNAGVTAETKGARNKLDNAYKGYSTELQDYKQNMGQADKDIWTRNKGVAFAGLDSGFADANDQLQASLARRGLSNSGIGAKSMGDLAQQRMAAGATANTQAFTSAINQSDARRGQRINLAGTLYGANQNNIQQGYQMGLNALGQNYGNTMAVRGQALQTTLNNNQQRIANLMGYAQLGRGMAGMSQNYLAQAGSGYTAIGNGAGQTAIGLGRNNVSYNSARWNSQAQANNAKGSGMGALVGAAGNLGAASIIASDLRLKDDLKQIGEINGYKIFTWKWNDKAREIGADKAPEFGVVAQDIMLSRPEAVVRDEESGYWKVNYSMLFGGE